MDGFLDDALAVPVPRRAGIDADALVLGHRRERPLDLPSRRVDDRGHPIDPPPTGRAAEAAEDLVDPDHQVHLVVAMGCALLTRVASRRKRRPESRLSAMESGCRGARLRSQVCKMYENQNLYRVKRSHGA